MWVKFLEPFDWRPRTGYVIAYKQGYVGNVTKRCGETAIEKGKAEKTERPSGMQTTKDGRTVEADDEEE